MEQRKKQARQHWTAVVVILWEECYCRARVVDVYSIDPASRTLSWWDPLHSRNRPIEFVAKK